MHAPVYLTRGICLPLAWKQFTSKITLDKSEFFVRVNLLMIDEFGE